MDDKIASQREDLISGKKEFSEFREECNNLFGSVVGAREQHNDVAIVRKLADVVKSKIQLMDNVARRYNINDFNLRIKTTYVDEVGTFSWSLLGQDIGVLSKLTPGISTFYGPIIRQETVRKEKAQRKTSERLVEVKPENVIQDEDDICEATNERLIKLITLTKDKSYKSSNSDTSGSSSSGNKEKFNLFELLVDPDDMVQTVENFFDFSYLVKEKRILFDRDRDTGIPMAIANEPDQQASTKNQMVLTMNMKDMKVLHKLLKDKSSTATHPLHRDDVLYSASDVHEQANYLDAMIRAERDKNKAKHTATATATPTGTTTTGSTGSRRKQ